MALGLLTPAGRCWRNPSSGFSTETQAQVKVGIVVGSLLAAMVGAAILRRATVQP